MYRVTLNMTSAGLSATSLRLVGAGRQLSTTAWAAAGQNLVEKIVGKHVVGGNSDSVKAGDFVSVRPQHVLTHDNTAAVMEK